MADEHGETVSPGFRECVGCGSVWDDRQPGAVGEHHYAFCPLEEGRTMPLSGSSEQP